MPRDRFSVPYSPLKLALAAAAGLVLAALLLWLLASGGGAPPASVPEDPEAQDTLPSFAVGGRFEAVEDEVAEFEAAIAEALDPVRPTRITGPIRFRVTDVAWTDPAGRPFLRVPTVIGRVAPEPLLDGQIVISNLLLQQPRALLVQPTPTAEWNFIRALGLEPERVAGRRQRRAGRAAPEPDEGVFVRSIEVRNGRVEMRLPERTLIFADLDARLPVVAAPANQPLRVEVAAVNTNLVLPAQDRRLAVQVEDAVIRFPEGQIDFQLDRLRLEQTVLTDLAGTFDSDLPGFGIRATGRAEDVRLADLQFISPRLPAEGTASFTFEVEPRPGGTFVRLEDLALQTGETDVAGSLAVQVGAAGEFRIESVDLRLDPLAISLVEPFVPRPIPFTGLLRGTVQGTGGALRFALDARLRPETGDSAFTARLTGLAAFTDEGFRIRRVQADLEQAPLAALRELVPGLPLAGRITGRFTLEGPPGEAPLTIDARFDLAGGSVVVEGMVDLTGAVPRYDVTGRLVGIELQQVVDRPFPPVRLTADFALEGRGTEPRELTAELDLSGTFAGWYTGPEDGVELHLTAADGLLDIEQFRAVMGPVAAAAEGTWSLGPRPTEGLRYRVLATSLGPLGPYLPFAADSIAGGALEVSGSIQGSLDAPILEGTLAVDELRYGDYAVGAAEGTYYAALTDTIPTIRLELGARGIETPQAGAFEAASLTLALTPPTFAFNTTLDRVAGGVIELESSGTLLAGGEREARIQRFVIDLGDDRWTLTRPAIVRWGSDGRFRVEDLVVADQSDADRVALDGTVFPFAAMDFQFQAVGLPLGDLMAMLGQEPVLAGELTASGTVLGGAAPELDIDYRILNGRLDQLAFTSLEGEFAYDDAQVVASATGVLSPAGRIDANVLLPARLVLADSVAFAFAERGRLEGSIQTDSLPLEIFEEFAPQARELSGFVTGEVALGGTAEDPTFDGVVRIVSGAATIPSIQRRFTDIQGTLVLEDETVRVERLQVRSDGTAVVSGQIAFEELSQPVADLTIELEEFRALGGVEAAADPAAVWGTLTVRGALPAVMIGGDLLLNDGTVRVPEFQQDPFARELEQFVEAGGAGIADLPGAQEPSFMDRLRINNLVVRAGDDVWFEMPDARAQLSGELTIFKEGEGLRIFGSLEGQHGTYTVRAGLLVRRLEIREAEIRFFGSPTPDPAIDITAARVTFSPQGERVEILLHVTGTASRPRLALTAPGGVQVPETELLSYLLFGRPTVGLGTFQPTDLQESVLGLTLAGGIADIFTLGLEDVLVEELGLPIDYFQVRLNDPSFLFGGSFENLPTFVLGKELGGDVFLTVDAGIPLLGAGTEFSETLGFAVEWRIDREWMLEAGIEPPIRRRILRFFNLPVNPGLQPRRQVFIDLRRRWTY